MDRRHLLSLTCMTAAASLLPGAAAEAATSIQTLLQRATATIEDLKHDGSFGNSRELMGRARAVMVVPQLIKGGFIFGAEGGNGVMVVHHRDRDTWSNPAFYGIGAGSFGLQIGLEQAELVMFVMSDRALRALMKNQVKLGVNAGLTVIVVGTAAEASATTNANVDVIAWARAKGAYAGITLAGSVIKPDNKAIRAYYGRSLIAEDILLHDAGNPRFDDAKPLRMALADSEIRSSGGGRDRDRDYDHDRDRDRGR